MAMRGWCGVCILLLLVFSALHIAEALMCYQCADTKADTPCLLDHEGLLNTSKGISNIYAKNCTDSNPRWDRCVIETHIGQRGEYSLIKRGCHDGKYFNRDINDTEFHNLKPNNFTTCAKIKLTLACFSFCTEDYCNGPQPEEEDPCIEYDPYSNDTVLPDGVVCRGSGIHDNGVMWLLNLAVVSIVWGVSIKRA